jgi:hypothetical protein
MSFFLRRRDSRDLGSPPLSLVSASVSPARPAVVSTGPAAGSCEAASPALGPVAFFFGSA